MATVLESEKETMRPMPIRYCTAEIECGFAELLLKRYIENNLRTKLRGKRSRDGG